MKLNYQSRQTAIVEKHIFHDSYGMGIHKISGNMELFHVGMMFHGCANKEIYTRVSSNT